jgi:DNA-binding MarR family transcriptional regulator
MTEPPETLGQVLDFMQVLWALAHALTRASRRMERTVGMTGPQRLVVRIVGQHPGISAGALARTLRVHPSTLTGVMRRLVERGAIERVPDVSDARRTLLRLTSIGERIDARRAGTIEARVRAALAGASASDVAAARRVLTRLSRALLAELTVPASRSVV